jgi:hypothetical protein
MVKNDTLIGENGTIKKAEIFSALSVELRRIELLTS